MPLLFGPGKSGICKNILTLCQNMIYWILHFNNLFMKRQTVYAHLKESVGGIPKNLLRGRCNSGCGRWEGLQITAKGGC